MREKWAIRIVLLTGLLVLLLAITFAVIQNPIETPDTTPGGEQLPPAQRKKAVAIDPQRIKAGQQVYKQQSCARCHSIAGEGNPRNPLDGVGARRTAEELRDWITGADVVQGALPAHVFKLKQTYRELSGNNLKALVIYMQSLRRQINRAGQRR